MSNDKRLKPNTIIPKDLYVERAADRQIRGIIENRGRPGYVLVARQMGKTNLLLHAKETLENSQNLISYIDLSNKLENERDCFRNIVDVVIETHESVLGDIYEKVIQMRDGVNLPPHKEHERELRLILGRVTSLVIILDEVDALTATGYSDKIFAQIRSIYFSRTNFPIFEKLTYVLSGVAEPSEIIKDKTISPFNIGDKIFLDDFTKEEFYLFFNKSKLLFSIEVLDRVFQWTNGNPRMTWEIASRLEDYFLISNCEVDLGLVNKVIKETYLEKMDLPPLDHIRDLVMSSQVIRNALVSIHYGKGETLSTSTKNKLYLAGIIGSNFSSKSIEIKNQILKESLTLEWLEDLEKSVTNHFSLAHEKFSSNNYSDAIYYFEKYLKEDGGSKDNVEASYIQLAFCYFMVGDYDNSLKIHDKFSFSKEEHKAAYYDKKFQIGQCHLAMQDYEKAVPFFKEIISNSVMIEIQVPSMLNLANCYFYYDFEKNKKDIKELCLGAIDILSTRREERFNSFYLTAYYNLGRYFQLDKDIVQSDYYYQKSYDMNVVVAMPIILLGKSQNSKTIEERDILFKKMISAIVSNQLVPDKNEVSSYVSFSYSNFYTILACLFINNRDLFNDLLEYAKQVIRFKKGNESEIYFELGFQCIDNRKFPETIVLFEFILESFTNDLTSEEKHICIKMINIYGKLKNIDFYIDSVEKNSDQITIDHGDLQLSINILGKLIKDRELDKAERFIGLLYNLKDKIEKDDFLLIEIMELNILDARSNNDSVLRKSRDLMKKIQSTNFFKDGDELTSALLPFLQTMISKNIPKLNTKIGRNDLVEVRYLDSGKIIEGKFKKLEQDIKNYKCEVLKILKKPETKK